VSPSILAALRVDRTVPVKVELCREGNFLVVQRSASRIRILRYYPATDARYGRHLMWDELKDIFTGPIGPWIGLLGLVVISLLWLEGERLLYTPRFCLGYANRRETL